MRVQLKKGRRTAGKQEKERRQGGERRQLCQLAVCAALFLAIFIGKGAFPEKIMQVGPQLVGVIRSNIDFQSAFSALGSTVTEGGNVLEGLEQFCVTVFGVRQEQPSTGVENGAIQVLEPEPMEQERAEDERKTEPEAEEAPEPCAPQIGDVVETIAAEGETLPENYTYDNVYLGEMETVVPVNGRLTSAFGYRNHPTIGVHAVHGGVDIGAASGTAIQAFADANVAFVGENEDFGLYLQLEHENNVSTFYSHCKSIEVKKGEQVRAGQTVARVGSTGKSTGPHLHFEVRLGDVRLDPMHYIELAEG